MTQRLGDILTSYNRKHPVSVKSAAGKENEIEEAYKKILEDGRKQELSRDPTVAIIPRFFVPKKAKNQPKDSAQAILKSEARRLKLFNKKLGVPSRQEIDVVADIMEDCKDDDPFETKLNYPGFCTCGQKVEKRFPGKFSRFFRSKVFLSFQRDMQGRIAIDTFYKYMQQKVARDKVEIALMEFDSEGDGFLRESEMERYIRSVMPTLATVQHMSPSLLPYYLIHAVRRYFFFLDPNRRGKISIQETATSHVMDQMMELLPNSSAGGDVNRNWFSMSYFQDIYNQFIQLDLDGNKKLSKRELMNFQKRTMTDTFVTRIFEEYPTEKGDLDYKGYMDFVLATKYRKTLPSLLYFWRLMDVRKWGYLTVWTINYFFREINKKLVENNLAAVHVEDVRDEIFDMVSPASPNEITFNDLKNCGCGDTVFTILSDVNGFWAYDNRESLKGSDPDEGN
eukprot:TRINITY_DN7041_c0_g1_i1.p1 TRINITY_DN7041_c0_g1~~TRINITY_DN7041_c0_g1_i1.p1  ORF type:complete len:452 (+),score=181.34 TRINITY_DN7041_c0_g1_i1:103-1458(+)